MTTENHGSTIHVDSPLPDWISSETREDILNFYAGTQDPIHAWRENASSIYNRHPEIGATVRCKLRDGIFHGRWLPMWNNIGRLILADGTFRITSSGHIVRQ